MADDSCFSASGATLATADVVSTCVAALAAERRPKEEVMPAPAAPSRLPHSVQQLRKHEEVRSTTHAR